MTPLPGALGGSALVAWRLDDALYASTWASGEGSYRVGGRWNSAGVRAVYAAIDPATAILEVAVHKGFHTLDTVPFVLTAITILDTARVHVVDLTSVPNPNWLRSGSPSAGQQGYGDRLLAEHGFILVPSVVSVHSWNVVFVAGGVQGCYSFQQESFGLDTRLHPPTGRRI